AAEDGRGSMSRSWWNPCPWKGEVSESSKCTAPGARDGRTSPAPGGAHELRELAQGGDEGEQVGVELILMGHRQAVGCTGIDIERRVRDDLRRAHGRRLDRHDLVVIPVDDEGGY